jgi:magnesium-transporting ATPase (P-type)
MKLFLETNFWNWYSGLSGLFCIVLYYLTVLVLSTESTSELLQPELNGEYFRILASAKAWIAIILIPVVALLPDIGFMFIQKMFRPTPTDAVMKI